MSSPEPPTETPGPDAPTGSTQPTYSNLGEVRAHLLPSKACRPPRKSGPPSADPRPLPPPLPKKTLSRTQSLPTCGAPSHTPAPEGQPRRAFLGSHSVDESQAGDGQARPACPPTEPAFGTLDASLGLSWHHLSRPEATHAVLEARQLQALRTVHARLQARLLGGHPGPCCSGHGFRLLDSSPCVESGDALYYRVVRVGNEAWHLLAAKVSKPGAEEPSPWGLELQASLPPHFNLQGLCGLVSDGALPEAPWTGPAVLAAEVPERTLRAAGGEAPGLEDWLHCEYLAEATEASLGQALALLHPDHEGQGVVRECGRLLPTLETWAQVVPRKAGGSHQRLLRLPDPGMPQPSSSRGEDAPLVLESDGRCPPDAVAEASLALEHPLVLRTPAAATAPGKTPTSVIAVLVEANEDVVGVELLLRELEKNCEAEGPSLRSGMVRLMWMVALGLSPSFSLAKQWLLRIRCREDFTIRPLGSETRKPPLRFSAPPPLLAVRKMAPPPPPAFIGFSAFVFHVFSRLQLETESSGLETLSSDGLRALPYGARTRGVTAGKLTFPRVPRTLRGQKCHSLRLNSEAHSAS
ncbi:uncharacterized protein PEAK3 [Suricata suricatta]|uniref:uncharacterized protein PEAK3 n=1 Tax=Suricata suricatta TaxID=37032 RepID=UPI0011559C7B|nr:uncharacterized protein PEAK3 [Suricata suricatta]